MKLYKYFSHLYLSRAILVCLFFASCYELVAGAPREYDPVLELMIQEANSYRAAAGVRPLVADPKLMAGAQRWSKHMRETGRMHHSNVQEGGYAENIACGQHTAAEVTRDWYESWGHKRNMLSPNYRYIGVGKDGLYWTQRFR